MVFGTALALCLSYALVGGDASRGYLLPMGLDGRTICKCGSRGDIIFIEASEHDTGARFRSGKLLKPPFTVSVFAKAAPSRGLVTAFYLSTGEPAPGQPRMQTEVDFEFLGKDPRGVQTNYFVHGVGDHEEWHELSFDTSAEEHKYTIDVSHDVVKWLVDGVQIREEPFTGRFPKMYVYLSLWDASQYEEWAGRVDWSKGPFQFISKILP
jgi:beta-glucanase (GH16 family)